jgi:hypothetical protein
MKAIHVDGGREAKRRERVRNRGVRHALGGQEVWMSYEKALFCSEDGELQVVYVHSPTSPCVLFERGTSYLSAGNDYIGPEKT